MMGPELPGTVNTIPEQFLALRGTWFAILFEYANDVFLILALIEVGLSVLLWMVYRHDSEALGLHLLKKVMYIGFMYAILLHASTWIPSIIDSFIAAGQEASGFHALNPGEVMIQGIAIVGKLLWEMVGLALITKPVSTLMGFCTAFIIFLSFVVIAIQLAVTLVESYIVTGAGVFLLGFSAFRGTALITERYLSYMVAVGVKLLVIYLIIGAGSQLAIQWAAMINTESMSDMNTAMSIAGGAMMYSAIAWLIPSVAGSLLSGAVSLGFQEVLGATVQATRIGASVVAAPIEMGRGAIAATSLAQAVSQQHGGGVRGALRGLGAAGGAVTQQVSAASVPRLHRGVQHLRAQAMHRQNTQNTGGTP